jgi:hypothetical protein
MNSKQIGIAVLTIGILYMILVSWLMSWWYVPAYRQLGPEFLSGSSFYTSIPMNIFWALSAPLGSMLVILGFSLSNHDDKRFTVCFAIGSIIILLWLGFWFVSSITSELYGIGGGIIIACFFISVWAWASKRNQLEGRNKIASDARIVGHLFFLIAAWGMCGLLGTPIFGLRPKLMLEFDTQPMTMGAKVLICTALGWLFLAFSQYVETYSSQKKP